MGFVAKIEIYRKDLTKIVGSLPGVFYLDDDNNQLYYYSMKRNCIENGGGRMGVDWDKFKKSCTKLSTEEVVNSLKEPKEFDFIISKFEESPLEYQGILKEISK